MYSQKGTCNFPFRWTGTIPIFVDQSVSVSVLCDLVSSAGLQEVLV